MKQTTRHKLRMYPKAKKAKIDFLWPIKIIVRRQKDKEELLRVSEYLHYFCVENKKGQMEGLDNDAIGVNLLMHLYEHDGSECPDNIIEVDPKLPDPNETT